MTMTRPRYTQNAAENIRNRLDKAKQDYAEAQLGSDRIRIIDQLIAYAQALDDARLPEFADMADEARERLRMGENGPTVRQYTREPFTIDDDKEPV